jgi:hypothetical protein
MAKACKHLHSLRGKTVCVALKYSKKDISKQPVVIKLKKKKSYKITKRVIMPLVFI